MEARSRKLIFAKFLYNGIRQKFVSLIKPHEGDTLKLKPQIPTLGIYVFVDSSKNGLQKPGNIYGRVKLPKRKIIVHFPLDRFILSDRTGLSK